MAKNSFLKFLKKFDRYDKTVTLKYKKKGGFQTSIGGLASIVTLGIFIGWMVIEFVDVYWRGKFIVTDSMQLTQALAEGLTYPVYSIE